MTWTVLDRTRENLIPYSNDFSEWVGVATVSSNAISDTSTSVIQSKTVSAIELCDDPETRRTRCFSLFILKDSTPDTTRYCAIRIMYGTGNTSTIRLDTSTGETYTGVAGNVVVNDSGVYDEDDYWRLWIASESDETLTFIIIYPALGVGDVSTVDPSAVATGSITCKNAQFEQSAKPSDYYETTGTHIYWFIQPDAS